MNTIPSIQRLFTYNDWANRKTLASLSSCTPLPVLSVKRMGHLIAAEAIWFERMASFPPLKAEEQLVVWPELPLDACEPLLDTLKSAWSSYFATLTDADLIRDIHYVNSKGDRFTNSAGDILTHLFAHGAYHRGQIAGDVRAAGGVPIATDFIFAIRDGIVL